MTEFKYAHKNTERVERESITEKFNSPELSCQLEALRKSAFAREIPVSDGETLNFLGTLLYATQPGNILEIGSAIGVSGAYMLEICENAHLTTIEKNEEFYSEALKNFEKLNLLPRVKAVYGDAGDEIKKLECEYDFIFLDGPKVQYIKYLPYLKRLLKKGGVLYADDVLLFGYVADGEEVPKKRKMLVEHIREYIAAVTCDKELSTTIINIGNGAALSVKI